MKCSLSDGGPLIEDFISGLFSYFNFKEEHYLGKYVSRKHNSGNLIFPCSISNNQSKLEEIVKNSSSMKFLIDDIKLNSDLNNYQVFLNQNSVFRTSLQTVCNFQESYGVSSLCGPKLEIIDPKQTFLEFDPLSSYRLYLCSVVLQKFLLFIYSAKNLSAEVSTSGNRSAACEFNSIFICNHRTRVERCDRTISIVCRTEINELNGGKNLDISYKDYKILREKDIRRNNDLTDDDSPKILKIVDACIIFDLLTNRFNMPVYLNLANDRVMSRNSSSKGAVFVLYTYARLTAIIKKFEEFVLEKKVQVPSIVETDFSILRNSEEKIILYNYILMFPVLIKEIWMELVNKEEFPINKLCLFLAQFSSTISKYYRSTRVLMTQTPDLFPLMFARIHLTRASLQVLHNGLYCLSIEPLSEM